MCRYYKWYVTYEGQEIRFADREEFGKFVLKHNIVNDNTLCRDLKNTKGSEVTMRKNWGEGWRNVFNNIEFFDTRRLECPAIRIAFEERED